MNEFKKGDLALYPDIFTGDYPDTKNQEVCRILAVDLGSRCDIALVTFDGVLKFHAYYDRLKILQDCPLIRALYGLNDENV